MSTTNKVEIKNNGVFTHVYIDGKELHGVRRIEFLHDRHEQLPLLRFDLIADELSLNTYVMPELPEAYKTWYEHVNHCQKCLFFESGWCNEHGCQCSEEDYCFCWKSLEEALSNGIIHS